MKRSRGNRNTAAHIEERRAKTVKLMNEGRTKAEIADQLRVSRITLWRDLANLRERYKTESSADFEAYRKAQLEVLELIEEGIVEGMIAPDVGNAWRQVRADISKLLGLDAPSKSVRIDAELDPEKLQGYRKWLAETKGLDDGDLVPVWSMLREIRGAKARKPIEAFFPSSEEGPCGS
jgi:DNA-binding CsgD family transcriptional regulator